MDGVMIKIIFVISCYWLTVHLSFLIIRSLVISGLLLQARGLTWTAGGLTLDLQEDRRAHDPLHQGMRRREEERSTNVVQEEDCSEAPFHDEALS